MLEVADDREPWEETTEADKDVDYFCVEVHLEQVEDRAKDCKQVPDQNDDGPFIEEFKLLAKWKRFPSDPVIDELHFNHSLHLFLVVIACRFKWVYGN